MYTLTKVMYENIMTNLIHGLVVLVLSNLAQAVMLLYVKLLEQQLFLGECKQFNVLKDKTSDLKFSWQLNSIKYSQASSHIRWLSGEYTNILRTDMVLGMQLTCHPTTLHSC
jgi:hypothetical protein